MIHFNKFGMFIHWGLYALTEQHEQALARYSIAREKYEALPLQFDPVKYDPEQWVLLAKNAGMKYICFTAKHHDGFCMWDTRYSDYNIMNTPYGRDVLKMLADACHKHGILLSIYYSNPDWRHPKGYNPASTHQWCAVNQSDPDLQCYKQYVKDQITELLTNYGQIYTLFWDIPPGLEDASINAYVRQLQPNILINDRGYDKGDFSTPERESSKNDISGRFSRPTEACNAIDIQSWGYRAQGDFYSYRHLLSSIDKIMAKGGSYLLNIGPRADGSLDPAHVDRIQTIGNWYNRMEGCLEQHEADEYDYQVYKSGEYIATRKNGKTYFHFWNGTRATAVAIKNYPSLPKSIRLMNTGAHLPFSESLLPAYFDRETGKCDPAYLYIRDIPVDALANEPIVIEVAW